jgi:hypothetical protein
MNPRNVLFLTWGIGSFGMTAMIASISFIALYYLIQVVGLIAFVSPSRNTTTSGFTCWGHDLDRLDTMNSLLVPWSSEEST